MSGLSAEIDAAVDSVWEAPTDIRFFLRADGSGL
jgi:hypothetical protein